MNFRFGIIFLVVASVLAIGQVNSEEANAETMVRREADPGMGAVLAKIKQLIASKGKREADPGMMDMLGKALKMIPGLGKRSADPGMASLIEKLKARAKGRKRNAGPDPGMLDMLKNIPFIGGFLKK